MTVQPDDDRARVRNFWRQTAPRFGLAASDAASVEPVAVSDRSNVYRLRDGAIDAAVRWPVGSLLTVNTRAVQANRVFVLAADLGLAPRVLAHDQGALALDGQPVIVSEFVQPGVPAATWFRDNLQQAAALLARLHRDEDLGDLLENFARGDRRGDALAAARGAWADLQQRLAALAGQDWPLLLRAIFTELQGHTAWFGAQIQRQMVAFRGVPVGPAHGDLNFSNWLVDEANRVTLIDWERARLDDSALDVGMVLHWLLPVALWPVFLRVYAAANPRQVDTDRLLARVQVRYPLHALDVCLWKLERFAAGHERDPAAAQAFTAPFLDDLRRLRAGTFGAG